MLRRFLYIGNGSNPAKTLDHSLRLLLPKHGVQCDTVHSMSDYTGMVNRHSYEGLIVYNAKLPMLQDQIQNNKQLRWVHACTAGVDAYLKPEISLPEHIPLTNVKSAYKENIAQYVLFATLFFAKETSHFQRAQRAAQWSPTIVKDASLQTALVVGCGDIGAECAKKLHRGLNMKVSAVKRCPESVTVQQRGYLDKVYGPENISEIIGDFDYVINTLPLTPLTRDFFDAQLFRRMKPSSIYMNLGRGGTNNENDLLAALTSGTIGGAVMDVFKTEPLPTDSDFYSLSNVLMTPHSADDTADNHMQAVRLFERILQRYVKGEPLFNVVDTRVGY